MTEDAILPVPIKPNFILLVYQEKLIIEVKKKPPEKGALNFFY
jgi:hypothetical protein